MVIGDISRPEQVSNVKTNPEISETLEGLPKKLEKEQVDDEWTKKDPNKLLDEQAKDQDKYQLAKYDSIKGFLLQGIPYECIRAGVPSFRRYNEPFPLMDSKYSLSELLSVWSALDHDLTESQKKLNKKLLNILKYLEWRGEGALFDYDNGQVDELKEFLKNNRGNPDLKAVLSIKRGESESIILHAVIGASYHHSLLRGNADPDICDGQGKTPQQIAADNHNYHVERCFFTDNQKKLREELNNILNKHRCKEGNLGYTVTLTPSQLLEDLKKFLHKHKNNQDLKVVLNIRDMTGELEVLKYVRNAFSGSQGADRIAADKIEELLLETEAKEFAYERKKCLSGVLWGNIIPAQEKKLSKFLGVLSEVQDINQLERFVKIAIESGVRLNYCFTVPSPFKGYSFTDYAIKRISELSELEENPKVASDIICQLVSKGAVFGSPESIDVIGELELECKDHEANMIKAFEGYINDAHRFIKVAKSATTSKLNDIAIDNTTLYLEYSEDSKIDIAKITDRARNLRLTQENGGYERNIIKIGESEVEIITQNGKRHYTDLTANSNIVLIFCTSFGELEVGLYSDKQNENRIRVEIRDQGMLKKLKDCGEEIGKNCSLGRHSVYDAIECGYFEKPAPSSRIVQEEKLQNSKWADQVRYTRKNEAQIGY